MQYANRWLMVVWLYLGGIFKEVQSTHNSSNAIMDVIGDGVILFGLVTLFVLAAAIWTHLAMRKKKIQGESVGDVKPQGR
jgi:hypothetical protein